MFSSLHQWLLYVVVYAIAIGETALVCKSSSRNDNTNVKNCTCIVEGTSFPTVLNLCDLDTDYCHIISKTEHNKPGTVTPLTVVRYYIFNLFRSVQSNNKKSGSIKQNKVCKRRLSGDTNCPTKSMCCLASIVTFECSNDQHNSVCMEPKTNADSYGYFKKWSIRQPSSDDVRDFKTARAVIQMTGGPCYFCRVPDGSNPKELVTLIGLFCDERITDEGHPILSSGPSTGNPKIIFHLNTSHSCYEFQSKEKCPEAEEPICKSKTFSCTSANYHFSFPAFANQSISKELSSTVEYTFGFCAHDIDCSTTKGNSADVEDVLICKKIRRDGQVVQASVVAKYKDIKEVIIRPTGFVWRIKKYGNLKVVVSFQCDADQPVTSNNFNLNVVPDKKHPLLLTLKHRCFCPNPPAQCSTGGPTAQPIIHTTAVPTGKPPHTTFAIVLTTAVIAVFVVFIIVLYIRQRRRQPTPPSSATNSESQNEPSDTSSASPSVTLSWHTACSNISARIASVLPHRPSTPTGRTRSKDQGVRSADATLRENSETVPLLRKHSTI